MCGILAYVNYLRVKNRSEILELLIKGLKRMEYYGLTSDDSTVAIDKAGYDEISVS